MSTTTLSQRLRDLKAAIQGGNNAQARKLVHECIAEAEAQDGQAGELSQEQVDRACEVYADNHPHNGPITVNRTAMRRALASVRPSQVIGEQKPVAWRNVRRNDLRIPVRLHNALASLALDTIGAIVDHLGVKVNDDRDGTYWRLRTALMKMRGVGRSSAIEGASAIMDAIDRPPPISPEARDRAIEALEITGRALANYESGVPIKVDDLRKWNSQALSALR